MMLVLWTPFSMQLTAVSVPIQPLGRPETTILLTQVRYVKQPFSYRPCSNHL